MISSVYDVNQHQPELSLYEDCMKTSSLASVKDWLLLIKQENGLAGGGLGC